MGDPMDKDQRRQLKQQYRKAASQQAASEARKEADWQARHWGIVRDYLDRASA